MLTAKMSVSLFEQKWRALVILLAFTAGMMAAPVRAALVDVEFAELPITDAFSLVSRQASLDVLIDPDLESSGTRPDKLPWAPPSLQLKLKQVAADQVLESMAGAYGLVLDRSMGPKLIKLRFAKTEELEFKRAPKLLPDPVKDQHKVPLLVFDDAPVLQVIQILATQSRLNLMPSLELASSTNAQGVAWQDVFIAFRIRDVTPQQALEAVLDASGLVVDWSALGQVGVIYPASRFAKAASKAPIAMPVLKEEKTDFTLADLELEDFVKLIARQLDVNWMVSTAARQATTGAEKQPLMQSGISISQKGITPLSALQEVLKGKGLQLRWNARAEVMIVDLAGK